MKISYTGDQGNEFEADVDVSSDTPARRGRNHCVVEFPWQGGSWIISWHASERAAENAARRLIASFRRRNPGGFGYSWQAARALA